MSSHMSMYARVVVVCALALVLLSSWTNGAAVSSSAMMEVEAMEYHKDSEFIQPTLVEVGELSMSSESDSTAIDEYTTFLEEELFQLDTAAATPTKKAAGAQKSAVTTGTKKDAASRLTSAVHKEKYDRFRKLNAKRLANTKSGGGSFATFTKNREAIVALNDKHGSDAMPTVFRSSGPFADLSAAEFKARYLTTKNFRQRKNKSSPMPKISAATQKAAVANSKKNASPLKFVRVPRKGNSKSTAKGAKAKKGGIALIESSNPVVDAGAGHTAGQSGKTGGYSGSTAKKSGKTGGEAGGTAKKSGKTGGDAGGAAKKSGKTGGNSGGNAKKSGKTGGTNDVETPFADGLSRTDAVVAPDRSKVTGFRKGATGVTRADVVKSLAAAGVSQATIDSTLNRMLDYGGILGLTPYETQGTCGSCWAESVATSLYFVYLKWGAKSAGSVLSTYTGKYRDQGPSVQQILDCTHTKESNGCHGGTPMDALDYLASVQMVTAGEYPRQANFGTGQCKTFPKRDNSPLVSYGWKFAIPECKFDPCPGQQSYELNLLEQLMTGASLPIVYIDASKLQHYSNGTFPKSECSSSLDAGNHIVQIVGVGTDDNGVPFWEAINSWGPDWGMKGRVRLPFGVNACGIANFAIVPRLPSDVPASSYGIDTVKDAASAAAQIAKITPTGNDANFIRNDKCMYDINKKLYLDYSKIQPGKDGSFSFSADFSTFWSPDRSANCNGIVIPAAPAAPTQEKMPYNKELGYVFDKVAGGWRKPRPGDIY